jgi:KaiC/GvpD/RAD55 family RecA-like ATPase
MNSEANDQRIPNGGRNFDEVLHCGVPSGELIVLAGSPVSGKTATPKKSIKKKAKLATRQK